MIQRVTEQDLIDKDRYPLVLPFRTPISPGKLPKDHTFPFGRVEEIDYNLLDQSGIELIRELNRRPWLATVSYCSGHPCDRPLEEETPISMRQPLYKEAKRWDYEQEMDKLAKKVRGHRITKEIFKHEIKSLLDVSRSWFNLNVNVYKPDPFFQWMHLSFMLYARTFMQFPLYQLPEVTFNPLFPVPNFNVSCGYYGMEHRTALHDLFVEALRNIPI